MILQGTVQYVSAKLGIYDGLATLYPAFSSQMSPIYGSLTGLEWLSGQFAIDENDYGRKLLASILYDIKTKANELSYKSAFNYFSPIEHTTPNGIPDASFNITNIFSFVLAALSLSRASLVTAIDKARESVGYMSIVATNPAGGRIMLNSKTEVFFKNLNQKSPNTSQKFRPLTYLALWGWDDAWGKVINQGSRGSIVAAENLNNVLSPESKAHYDKQINEWTTGIKPSINKIMVGGNFALGADESDQDYQKRVREFAKDMDMAGLNPRATIHPDPSTPSYQDSDTAPGSVDCHSIMIMIKIISMLCLLDIGSNQLGYFAAQAMVAGADERGLIKDSITKLFSLNGGGARPLFVYVEGGYNFIRPSAITQEHINEVVFNSFLTANLYEMRDDSGIDLVGQNIDTSVNVSNTINKRLPIYEYLRDKGTGKTVINKEDEGEFLWESAFGYDKNATGSPALTSQVPPTNASFSTNFHDTKKAGIYAEMGIASMISVFVPPVLMMNKETMDLETSVGQDLKHIIEQRNKPIKRLAGAYTPTQRSNKKRPQSKKDELNKNIFQCVLLAGFEVLEKISIGMRTGINSSGAKIRRQWSGNGKNFGIGNRLPYPYGGRIIPLGVKPYQNCMNALSIPLVKDIGGEAGINDYLGSTEEFTNGYVTSVRISKIVKNYKDAKGKLMNNGEVVKLPIAFTMAELIKDKDSKTSVGEEFFLSDDDKTIIGKENLIRDNVILIKSISVDFKGGNMATAKSDVEIKMSFTLPDIHFLDQDLRGYVTIDKKVHEYKYSFLDLITYTNESSPTGYASIFKGQYHPDYNRLQLESYIQYVKPLKDKAAPWNYKNMNTMLSQVPLVLDIAVVDHEIKKDEQTNQAEITVSYRGYVHAAMSDPSYDALAGPEMVDRRVNREIDLQKKLKDGCSMGEIRNIIRKYSGDARAEASQALPRVIDELSNSNRLFTVSVLKSSIRRSLDIYNESIDKPYEIKTSLETGNAALKVDSILEAWYFWKAAAESNADEKTINSAIRGTYLNGGKKMFFATGIDIKRNFMKWYQMSGQSKKGSGAGAGANLTNERKRKSILDRDYQNIEFFFFGDLIDVLLDGVHLSPVFDYKAGVIAENRNIRYEIDKMFSYPEVGASPDTGYYFKPDPIKIILSSFDWYEIDRNNKINQVYSNLADVPISLEWFSEWMKEEVIKKKLQYYPIVTFIKKLAQTVITRLLGDICFNVGNDKKVLFRATSDIGLIGDTFAEIESNKKKNTTNLLNKYYNFINTASAAALLNSKGAYIVDYNDPSNLVKANDIPILKKKSNNIEFNRIQKDHYMNYITVYPANATSFEYLSSRGANVFLRNGIPTFKYSYELVVVDGESAIKPTSIIKSMAFTKKDAPYRREVKFFASNQGNIAQISGVYNVKISLTSGAYFLYPGQIIYVDAGLRNAPDDVKSKAFLLGIGGYYQIISVNHKIEYFGGQSPTSVTSIDAAWVSFGLSKDKEMYGYYRVKKQQTNPTANCNSTVPAMAPNKFRAMPKNFRDLSALDTGKRNSSTPTKKPGAPSPKSVLDGKVPKLNTVYQLVYGPMDAVTMDNGLVDATANQQGIVNSRNLNIEQHFIAGEKFPVPDGLNSTTDGYLKSSTTAAAVISVDVSSADGWLDNFGMAGYDDGRNVSVYYDEAGEVIMIHDAQKNIIFYKEGIMATDPIQESASE